jgi:hypothetical protein
MLRAPGTTCRLTYDSPVEVLEGDFIRSSGGPCYLVEAVHRVPSERWPDRWLLDCRRLERRRAGRSWRPPPLLVPPKAKEQSMTDEEKLSLSVRLRSAAWAVRAARCEQAVVDQGILMERLTKAAEERRFLQVVGPIPEGSIVLLVGWPLGDGEEERIKAVDLLGRTLREIAGHGRFCILHNEVPTGALRVFEANMTAEEIERRLRVPEDRCEEMAALAAEDSQ